MGGVQKKREKETLQLEVDYRLHSANCVTLHQLSFGSAFLLGIISSFLHFLALCSW